MPTIDDDTLDESGLLRDGARRRIRFMDAQRFRADPDAAADDTDAATVQDSRRSFSDRDMRSGGPFSQQDRRRLTDSELADRRRIVADAYAAHDKAESERWQHPFGNAEVADAQQALSFQVPQTEFTGGQELYTGRGAPGRTSNSPAGAYPYQQHREGTPCTVNGAPGTLQRQGNDLVCTPTNNNSDARFTVSDQQLRIREQAYADADRADAERWRNVRD